METIDINPLSSLVVGDTVFWSDGTKGTVVLEGLPQWRGPNTTPVLHILWEDGQRTDLKDADAMQYVSQHPPSREPR